MLTWIKQFFEFIINNWVLIKQYPSQFFSIAFIIIALSCSIFNFFYKRLKEENKKLSDSLKDYKEKCESLKKCLSEAGLKQRLLMGLDENEKSPSAVKLSNHIKNG